MNNESELIAYAETIAAKIVRYRADKQWLDTEPAAVDALARAIARNPVSMHLSATLPEPDAIARLADDYRVFLRYYHEQFLR